MVVPQADLSTARTTVRLGGRSRLTRWAFVCWTPTYLDGSPPAISCATLLDVSVEQSPVVRVAQVSVKLPALTAAPSEEDWL